MSDFQILIFCSFVGLRDRLIVGSVLVEGQ